MDHTHRVRPGPTLAECEAQGATHLELQCRNIPCGHRARLEIGAIAGPRNTPVNHMNWRCKKCRSINISVGLVMPKELVIPAPAFDMKKVRPKKRRGTPCGGG